MASLFEVKSTIKESILFANFVFELDLPNELTALSMVGLPNNGFLAALFSTYLPRLGDVHLKCDSCCCGNHGFAGGHLFINNWRLSEAV